MNDTRPILYDLVTKDGRSLSPWCWHAKMAIAHKNIDVEIRPRNFSQKDELIKAGGKTYPCMIEANGVVSDDSKIITDRLEELIPSPSLFPGGGQSRSTYDFIHAHIQAGLAPNVAKMIIADIPKILHDDDLDYFISSREKRFGMKLAKVSANREDTKKTFANQLEPFRKAIDKTGWLSGDKPAMADYALFGIMQWARVSSPFKIINDDDHIIATWMERILDLHDGLGRKTQPATS